MKEIFLLKLGEIVLKGANKRQFESRLRQNVRRRMKLYGNFDVYLMQSTVYVEPMDDACDVDAAWEACRSIFGVVSLCRCRPCEKNTDAIFEAIENYLGDDLDCAKSFKVESKRSDKRFPLTSIQLSQKKGNYVENENHPHKGLRSPKTEGNFPNFLWKTLRKNHKEIFREKIRETACKRLLKRLPV